MTLSTSGDITVTVTPSVAHELLRNGGFTRDARGRWIHPDGRLTWASDEALKWALVNIADDSKGPGVTVRRTGHTIVYEHAETATVLAEVIRLGHKWHTCCYHPTLDDPDYDEWDDRESAVRHASRHAHDIAAAL
jgi:hypothetical protein